MGLGVSEESFSSRVIPCRHRPVLCHFISPQLEREDSYSTCKYKDRLMPLDTTDTAHVYNLTNPNNGTAQLKVLYGLCPFSIWRLTLLYSYSTNQASLFHANRANIPIVAYTTEFVPRNAAFLPAYLPPGMIIRRPWRLSPDPLRALHLSQLHTRPLGTLDLNSQRHQVNGIPAARAIFGI